MACGSAAAVLSAPVNLLLIWLAEWPGVARVVGTNFWVSQAVFPVFGSVAGAMSDLWRRLHEELAIRRRAEAELEHMARHDPLTGARNGHSLDEILRREVALADRHDRPIGFLMIDINRFKEVNDRFGHRMGDRVLQAVAGILIEQTRESDYVFRYGGDEFLVVLPESEALVVRRRIEEVVRRRNETNPLLEFPVTLAIGSLSVDDANPETLDTMLVELDRRMYEDERLSG